MSGRARVAGATLTAALIGWQLAGRRRRAALGWHESAATSTDVGLHVRHLGTTGPVVLLLHGLVASGRYWGAAYDPLADHARLVAPDLLGFGASPRPERGYGPDDHVDAILSALGELGALDGPIVIGAHSVGTLIAIRLAHRHPELVRGIVAFGPPIYPSPGAARGHLGHVGPMARVSTIDPRAARAVCAWVCDHRRPAGVLAGWLRPDLPAPIARDAVLHSWASYSETLDRLIVDARAAHWLDGLEAPVEFVVGDRDRVPDVRFLRELAERHERVTVHEWPGASHTLPLSHAPAARARLAAMLGSGAALSRPKSA